MAKFQLGRRATLWFWGFAAVLGLGAAAQWWPGYAERVIAATEIRGIGGHSYYVEPLGLEVPTGFRIDPDVNGFPTASRLVLYEDGAAIGPAHSMHATIVAQGLGAYSHWGNGLHFSTSDNSDPRTNGRRYSVRTHFEMRRRLSSVLFLTVVVGLLITTRSLIARIPWRAIGRVGLETTTAAMKAAPAASLGVLAALAVYLGYAWLVDPLGALSVSRTVSVKLAMYGMWFAIGVLLVMCLHRRELRSWRLVVALIALAETGCFLFLRAEAYRDEGLLPSVANIIPSLLAGIGAGYLARLDPVRQRYAQLRADYRVDRRALAGVIVFVLCLAAPMIWSPVVQNWNASGWMDSRGYDVYAHNILSGKQPEGSSQYMPVYQYGMAAVYYLFGHFFFAQQLVNGLLAFLTTTLICLSAWNLFRNLWAVLLIGIWTAFARQMVYAVFFTQIEAWYLPIVAFSIFAWTSYWRTPSKGHLLLLAVAAGIGINTRNQGAFFFGWLCLAPMFIAALPWRRRFTHVAIAVVILVASLVPWSLRNYVIDGRMSPSSARNAIYMAILNDPRIGFYGVRYWEGWGEITEDYARKYPDPLERDRAMMRAGLRTPIDNPDWFMRAMFWRTLAFYGVIAPGVFDAAGPAPTNWAAEWRGYIYWRTTPLLLLPLSLIGLITRPGRTTLFLAGGVVANIAVSAITGGAEDRVSYPVLPLHMLMALAAIFPPRVGESGWHIGRAVWGAARARTWIAAGAAAAAFLVLARVHYGQPNLYAPQMERGVILSPDVTLDQTLPALNDYAVSATPAPAPAPEWEGRAVRLRVRVLNYQCPPKFGGRIGYLPLFATEPGGPTYYCAAIPVVRDGKYEELPIAVAWFGATLNEPLREGDQADAEGRLLVAPPSSLAAYWLRIDKARKVVAPLSDIPKFF